MQLVLNSRHSLNFTFWWNKLFVTVLLCIIQLLYNMLSGKKKVSIDLKSEELHFYTIKNVLSVKSGNVSCLSFFLPDVQNTMIV